MDGEAGMNYEDRFRHKEPIGPENWRPDRPSESERGRMMGIRERGGGGGGGNLEAKLAGLKTAFEDKQTLPGKLGLLIGKEELQENMKPIMYRILQRAEQDNPGLSGVNISDVEVAKADTGEGLEVRVKIKKTGAVVGVEFVLRNNRRVGEGIKIPPGEVTIDMNLPAKFLIGGMRNEIAGRVETVTGEIMSYLREKSGLKEEEAQLSLAIEGENLRLEVIKTISPAAEEQAKPEATLPREKTELEKLVEKYDKEITASSVEDRSDWGRTFHNKGPTGEDRDGLYRSIFWEKFRKIEEANKFHESSGVGVYAVSMEADWVDKLKGQVIRPGDVAVCVNYTASETTGDKRKGSYSAIFQMPGNTAKEMLNDIRRHPEMVMALVECRLGAELKGIKVEENEKVSIFPNQALGVGQIETPGPAKSGPEQGKGTTGQVGKAAETTGAEEQGKKPAGKTGAVRAEVGPEREGAGKMRATEIREELIRINPEKERARLGALKNELVIRKNQLDNLAEKITGKTLKELVRERVTEVLLGGDKNQPWKEGDQLAMEILNGPIQLAGMLPTIVSDELDWEELARKEDGQNGPEWDKLVRVRVPVLDVNDWKEIKKEIGLKKIFEHPGRLFATENRVRFEDVAGVEAGALDKIVEASSEEIRFGAAKSFWVKMTEAMESEEKVWGERAKTVVDGVKEWINEPEYALAGISGKVERLVSGLEELIPGADKEIKTGYALAVVGLDDLSRETARQYRECLLFEFEET